MDRISDAICADHRELKSYYDRIVQAEDPDEQTRWQNMFTWELARHVVGEELVLYPALKKHLNEEATADRQQHQTVRIRKRTLPKMQAKKLHRSKKN